MTWYTVDRATSPRQVQDLRIFPELYKKRLYLAIKYESMRLKKQNELTLEAFRNSPEMAIQYFVMFRSDVC
jgi:hypothetical protein